MAEERLNSLEEKLKQLLTELEGTTGDDDWGALNEQLDKHDATGAGEFGATLAALTGEVDAADWDAISNRLDTYDGNIKRRKRAIYISITAAVVAALVAMFTVSPFNTSERTSTSNNEVANDNKSQKSPDVVTQQDLDNTSNSANDAIANVTDDNDNSSTTNTTSNNTTINNVTNNNSGDVNNNTGGNDNQGEQDEQRVDNNSDVTDNDTNQENPTEDKPVNDDKLATNDNQQDENEGDDVVVDENQPKDDNKLADANKGDESEDDGDEGNVGKIDVKPDPQETEDNKQTRQLDENPLRNKVTIGLFLSPEYVITSFKTNPTESSWAVNKRYEEINENQRKNAMGFTTGINVNYNPFEKLQLSIRTGVRYTENRQNVDFDFEQNEFILTDDNTQSIYYFPLPPDEVTEVKHQTTNIFSYIEVPFSFGYNFNLNERWSIAPTIGGSYTKLIGASGVKLNETTLEVEDINKDQLNNTNWTLQATVGVYYQLGNKFSVGVIPTYRTYLQTIEGGANYLQNRPYTIGINTGIRYSLF